VPFVEGRKFLSRGASVLAEDNRYYRVVGGKNNDVGRVSEFGQVEVVRIGGWAVFSNGSA